MVQAARAIRGKAQQEPDDDKGMTFPENFLTGNPGFLQEILVMCEVVLIIKGLPVN